MKSLRLSVTDRCNARCKYCMPEPEYIWLPKDKLLTFEEIRILALAAIAQGVTSIRLTGGEPLLRSDLPVLVGMLADLPGLEDLALTTNGILLAPMAEQLRRNGLQRITISIDTLEPKKYAAFAGVNKLDQALAGLRASQDAGFTEIKINTVVIRGFNDDELVDMLQFARREHTELRFIEYMDVGGATRWQTHNVLSASEILGQLSQILGPIEALPGRGSAPGQRYRTPQGQVFGVIASVTEPFCGACDRARITADGTLYTCLYGESGVDLRSILRGPAGIHGVEHILERTWSSRRDQGAVERTQINDRSAWVSIDRLRQEPRLEMHTRGG